MEPSPRGEAQPTDIARIRRNLRLDEDDVQHRRSVPGGLVHQDGDLSIAPPDHTPNHKAARCMPG